MAGFVLAAGQADTLVESCLMFRTELGGGQGVRAARVLVEREGERARTGFESGNLSRTVV